MRSDQNSLRRYFPESTQTLLGVSNTEVIKLAGVAFAQHRGLTAEDWLARAERFAQDHTYHEYFIMASALVAKVVRGLDDKDGRLLKRLQVWLERYVSNWAQCDETFASNRCTCICSGVRSCWSVSTTGERCQARGAGAPRMWR